MSERDPEAEALEAFGFCSCDVPEDALAELVRGLDWASRDLKAGYQPWSGHVLTLYVLDAAGMTEHGGALCASWISAKGKAWLARWGDRYRLRECPSCERLRELEEPTGVPPPGLCVECLLQWRINQQEPRQW